MDTDYFLKIGRLIDEVEKIEEERTKARKEHKEVGKIRRAKWDTDMAEIEATRLEYIKGIKEQGIQSKERKKEEKDTWVKEFTVK